MSFKFSGLVVRYNFVMIRPKYHGKICEFEKVLNKNLQTVLQKPSKVSKLKLLRLLAQLRYVNEIYVVLFLKYSNIATHCKI